MSSPVRVIALYRFTPFDDLTNMRMPLLALCNELGVRGTLLLAAEGINGTIAGSDDAIDRVLAHLRALPGCADLTVKESRADALPFDRMKIRLKREIVTMGKDGIDPRTGAGDYVDAKDWNALIDQPDVILIDTRNDYEVELGSFPNAINPRIKSFRDFPAWYHAQRDVLFGDRAPKIAMFCTGGIRCEKASAFLRAEGLDDVYHLRGGILEYLEKIPPAESLWRGGCFVFDQRVALTHGLAPCDETADTTSEAKAA